jgi:hypothetical protein
VQSPSTATKTAAKGNWQMTALLRAETAHYSQALVQSLGVHSDGVNPFHAIPEHVREEAARKLPALQRAVEPADAEAWRQFLQPLGIVVRNPPTPAALGTFAAACAMAMRDIPASLLTGDAQREACRRFAFWPSCADLDEWLRPLAAPMRADLAAMRRIAAALPPPPAPERMTPKQIEAASATLTALREELHAKGAPPRTTPRAAPVPADKLAAIYRADAERMQREGRAHMAEQFRKRADFIKASDDAR